MSSRVNVVLITSATYNLEFFVRRVFWKRDGPDWDSNGDPAYAHSGMQVEIDRDLYDREFGIDKKKKKPNRLTSLFKFGDNKVEVPVMVISTSHLTFTNEHFYNYTVQKMKEADVMIMFYDKTGTGNTGLHRLIEIYCKYREEIENDDEKELNSRKQPCLLIELIKPDTDYKNIQSRDISLADQIDGFRSLILNNSGFYHICLEVTTIPPDIYSVIKSMILETL
jgi:hypothetical protein